jgi:hypothetical protein
MRQDVQFALRLFARQRGFFATTVLTIALGVALSSTVFAVVDGVLFIRSTAIRFQGSTIPGTRPPHRSRPSSSASLVRRPE